MVRSDAYLFADDTKIFAQITKPEDQEKLQEDLNKLTKWSNTWLLRFHPEKCKLMTVSKGENHQRTYTLSDKNGNVTTLERVNEEKDLGVTFDARLSFESHISEKVNKANRMMGIIRRTYINLNCHNFKLLYKALVRSHLEYANSVWYPYKKKYIT